MPGHLKRLFALCLVLCGFSCSSPTNNNNNNNSGALPKITQTAPVQVVPNDNFPAEVTTRDANNNLDIIDHDGRFFLSFRTAPTHFASKDTTLYVLSTTDQKSWTFEAKFHLQSDLREPRFFSFQGKLWLYFAQLGSNPTAFEPGKMWRSQRNKAGDWTEPAQIFKPGFIPWRIKVFNNTPYMIGYDGGENIYNFSGDPLNVYLLTTKDGGDSWVPLKGDTGIVLTGGSSETDIEFDDQGNLYAVSRNEAGDETGFGMKICKAPKDDITKWTCKADPKKYDSPLLFKHGSHIFLVGRRNVTETGHYDLKETSGTLIDKLKRYQANYWSHPKRCALWHFDTKDIAIKFLQDLPSRGDTCFPSVVARPNNTVLLYNYSSDINGPDEPWVKGQLAPTFIYAHTLTFTNQP